MQDLPLNGFYESTTPKNSRRRCVNLIPINEPSGSLSQNMLECPSGLTNIGPVAAASATATQNYSSTASGEITSQITPVSVSPNATATASGGPAVMVPYDNDLMFVTDDSGKPTRLSFADGFGHARIAESQDSIIICSPAYSVAGGSYAEVQYPGTSVSAINVASEFPLGSKFHDVTFAGGRYLWVSYDDTGSDRFRVYYTDIGDSLPKATQFFSPDAAVSRLTGIHNLNGSVWVFDENNAYLFTITTSTTTPFSWQRSATQGIGCVGPHAKCEIGGILYTLGKVEGGGYGVFRVGAGKISTPAVEYELTEQIASLDYLSALKECKLFGYRDAGRDILSVSVAGVTFCYNITDGRWFEMSTDDGRWSVIGFGEAFNNEFFIGNQIVVDGSDITFQISNPKQDTGQEWGEDVSRFMVSAPFNSNNMTMRLSQVEPETSGAGDVHLSLSQDYGETYGTERTISVTSESQRVRFINPGIFRKAVVLKLRLESSLRQSIVRLLAVINGGVR